MKPIMNLSHPDGVSGTTIFDDGTKAFWTEGRSEHTYIVWSDGRKEYTSAYLGEQHHNNPAIKALNEDEGLANAREMTLAEEIEWMIERAEKS